MNAPAKNPSGSNVRLWPALVIVAGLWGALLSPQVLEYSPATRFSILIFAPMIAAGLMLGWWLFFSRVSWKTRLLGLGIAATTFVMFKVLGHKSTRDFILMIWVVPTSMLTFVLGYLLLQRSQANHLRWLPAVGMLLGAVGWMFVRLDGVSGERGGEYSFRWATQKETRFLEELAQRKTPPPITPAENQPAAANTVAWHRFRGNTGKSVVEEEALNIDWKTKAPVLAWKKLIGPAWSSLVVDGDRVITQEQRGSDEAVVCYSLATGNEFWVHTDPVRFEETVSGIGPRSTPLVHQGRVYTFGGEGLLNCLDLSTGKNIWHRKLAQELKIKPPMWGYSSSPAVIGDGVVVFPQGKEGQCVVTCDLQTGSTLWSFGDELKTYSSPEVVTIAGIEQVLILANDGLTSLDRDGKKLWQFAWKLGETIPSIQPQLIGDNQLLFGAGDSGSKLIEVKRDGDQWSANELWTSLKLKPDFNDFVVHQGYIYGFDGRLLTCLDLTNGQQKWKGGRYGTGQLLLLAKQNLLLVVGDKGEVALVPAEPQSFRELHRTAGISGKTWNHPVLVGGRLVLRNSEEIACYDLLP